MVEEIVKETVKQHELLKYELFYYLGNGIAPFLNALILIGTLPLN